ncbi:methyltransferase domain-containing protein [Candidatus Peregrinibacteria bacterium]|nr:methyltransferase domain-containing protein [Candidatus Peregrinibacteria bacterium]
MFPPFVCPHCHAPLLKKESALHCASCQVSFPLKNHIPFFLPLAHKNVVASHQSPKTFLRRIVRFFLPPNHSIYLKNLRSSLGEGLELKAFLATHPDLSTIVNIGSLSKNLKSLHPAISNLDLHLYPNVDIVADVTALPFPDNSIDMILFKNVLEHVPDPLRAMSEIYRVLKKGGYLYIKIPFLQPFHAVPDDFQRYTISGIQKLMREYEELDFGVSVGPGSMLSWVLREFFAILLSFGNETMYRIGLIFWGWLTFWLKYLDVFFRKNRLARNLASAFWGMYRKK